MNIKELKNRALKGDLEALAELRKLGVLSSSKKGYLTAPASNSQKRLWSIHNMNPSNVYNISATFELVGTLNNDVLQQAFSKLIERHESLRTCFVDIDSVPYQKIFSQVEFKIETAAAASKEEIEREACSVNEYVYDLSVAPLLRVKLIKESEKKHYMAICFHHIITDGWSINILINELSTIYNLILNNEKIELIPNTKHYKDFSAEQAKYLQSAAAETDKGFWTEHLQSPLPKLEFPTDFTRTAIMSNEGGIVKQEFNPDLVNKLNLLAKNNNTTMFNVVMAAVYTLLHRYTQKNDIIVGFPVSGRDSMEFENVSGFFVNTVPLRMQFDSNVGFKELLSKLSGESSRALSHSRYPFDLLVEEIGVERSAASNPVFDVMFSYYDLPTSEIDFHGLEAKIEENEFAQTKFDLNFNFEMQNGKLKMYVTFNSGLYKNSRIELAIRHLNNIIRHIASNPDTKLHEIEIMDKAEIDDLLSTLTNQDTRVIHDRSFVDVFSANAAKNPDKLAFVCGDESFTYSEADALSNCIANELIDNYKLANGTPVLLYMQRTALVPLYILGVLKSGGYYIGIDDNMPIARVLAVAKDSNAKLIISDNEIELNDETITFLQPDLHSTNKTNSPNIKRSLDDIFTAVYTSGSTGLPKGCLLAERSITRIFTEEHCLAIANSAYLSVASIGFDGFNLDLLSCFGLGNTLVLLSREEYDAEEIKSVIIKHKIESTFLPTGFWANLCEADKTMALGLFAELKRVIIGGDKVSLNAADYFCKTYKNVALIDVYGPAECSIYATTKHINYDYIKNPTIGKAAPNTKIYICDANMNIMPHNVKGEIYIGGAAVSHGYINNAELNSERFISKTIKCLAGDRVYKTGDLGLVDNHGEIKFLGREDFQVKIRGYRIELGEIEKRISAFPEIERAFVTFTGETEAKEIVVYYISQSDLDMHSIKVQLKSDLPDYMIPAHFIRVDNFPLSNNGKVDRAALPQPIISTENKSDGQFTLMERELRNIWGELLNTNAIERTSHFFELGGNSIRAIKLVNTVKKHFAVDFEFKKFFADPTFESLAEMIKSGKRSTSGEIPMVEIQEYYELSNSQKRLWVLGKLMGDSAVYNIPLAVRIKGEIEYNKLNNALKALIAKHEVLRTAFVEQAGKPYQKVFNSTDAEVKQIQCSAAEMDSVIQSLADYKFDLSQPELIRLSLITTPDNSDTVIVMNIHHIIADGESMPVIMKDLNDFYSALANSAEPDSKFDNRINYKDYVYWHQSMLANQKYKNYWSEKLSGDLEFLHVDYDFPKPPVKTYNGADYRTELPEYMFASIKEFAKKQKTTVFATLTATLKALLHRYTGKEDIIIGTTFAGREHPDLDDQIGYFVNTLPLRDKIQAADKYIDLLESVRYTINSALEHSVYPLDSIIQDLKIDRHTDRSPIFDILITMNEAFDGEYKFAGTDAESITTDLNIAKFDLTFEFTKTNAGMSLRIEYNTDLYLPERINNISQHFINMMQEVITSPESSVGELQFLSEYDLKAYNHLNASEASYPENDTVVTVFNRIAAQYPDRIAVTFGNNNYTYDELISEADRIRDIVISNRQGDQEYIALLFRPSFEMIAAILGVLKSGCGYLPIDPDYPADRIEYILSDSKAGLMITDIEGIADKTGTNVININDKSIKTIKQEDVIAEPNTTCYVVYTSGSTGFPKGCKLSHKNLIRLLFNDKNRYDFNCEDVWLLTHSYCFDFSVWDIFGALLYGANLLLCPKVNLQDIRKMRELLKEHSVTVLNQTPGVFYKLCEVEKSFSSDDRLNIRYVLFGGDKLNFSNLRSWAQKYPVEQTKLINMYGITETAIHSTYYQITQYDIDNRNASIIGVPLPDTTIFICDENSKLLPVGTFGEIFVGGGGVALGYIGKPELNKEKFSEELTELGARIYKSGDVARLNFAGELDYLHRKDFQVQIRGFRVEMTEIEVHLKNLEYVKNAHIEPFVLDNNTELAAYIVFNSPTEIQKIKSDLSKFLPSYMIPLTFIQLDEIPLNHNGKIDKKRLPEPKSNIATGAKYETYSGEIEKSIFECWEKVLENNSFGINDNFFDVGGNSLLLVNLHYNLEKVYPGVFSLTDLFALSTISKQAERIDPKEKVLSEDVKTTKEYKDIAIIGVSFKLADYHTFDEFALGIDKAEVKVGDIPENRKEFLIQLAELEGLDQSEIKFKKLSYINEINAFDYNFFKLSPKEAELLEPAQRLMLETVYSAMEDAGYGGEALRGSNTGVYIGAGNSAHTYEQILQHAELSDMNQLLPALTPSIVASRISYFMNLRGPAMIIDTACSSSLTAIHYACEALRSGECDYSIAGGVKLHLLPFDLGSKYEIDSSDGFTRPFDAASDGTGAGEGVIAFLLKPLESSIRDNDNIYAVIKGSALNQDGASVGITAPNVEAQTEVIVSAWQNARINPENIAYIEAHGTGTKLGDPIEIAGLTGAFRQFTGREAYVGIGSAKANFGHLDYAAGALGMLKAIAVLRNGKVPPIPFFKKLNPNIENKNLPLYFPVESKDYSDADICKSAGISAFGLSGTNCHVVIEEYKNENIQKIDNLQHLFVLSAPKNEKLKEYIENLITYFEYLSESELVNACYTLACGRFHFNHRIAVTYSSKDELLDSLHKWLNGEIVDNVCSGYFRTVSGNAGKQSQQERTNDEIREFSAKADTLINDGKSDLLDLARLYIAGANVDWNQFSGEFRKLSIPTYPFEKNICRVALNKSKAKKHGSNANAGVFFTEKPVVMPDMFAFSAMFAPASNSILHDHRISDRYVLPGAAYIQVLNELAQNAGICKTGLSVKELIIMASASVDSADEELNMIAMIKSADYSLQIMQNRNGEFKQLIQGAFYKSQNNTSNELFDLQSLISNSKIVYERTENMSLGSGFVQASERWNCLDKIYQSSEYSIAELQIKSEFADESHVYFAYTPLLDVAISFNINAAGFMPFSMKNVLFEKPLNASQGKVYSVCKELMRNENNIECEIHILDSLGGLIARFERILFKKAKLNYSSNSLFEFKKTKIELDTKEINQNKLVVVEENEFDNFDSEKLINAEYLVINIGATGDYSEKEVLIKKVYSSIFNFAKSLSLVKHKLNVAFVYRETDSDDAVVSALVHSLLGISQVLERENHNLKCRFIASTETDLDKIYPYFDSLFDSSIVEWSFVAGEWRVKQFDLLSLEVENEIQVKSDGYYMITGGTGGLGLAFAEYLLERKANVVLVDRTALPANIDEIVDEHKREKLHSFTEHKYIYKHFACDIADAEAYEELIIESNELYGRLNGVVHSAGIAGSGFLREKDFASFESVLNAKICGTLNIVEYARRSQPDFVLLCSAITAFVPTSGQSDYTTANLFLDELANGLKLDGTKLLSVNFTAIKDAGMAHRFGVADDFLFKAMTSRSAAEQALNLLTCEVNNAILGEVNPEDNHFAVTPFAISPNLLKIQTKAESIKPEIKTETVAAVQSLVLTGKDDGAYTASEQIIGAAYSDEMGYKEINIFDNFYDLGGDSINAIMIVNQIRESGYEVEMSDLFANPSIAQLAQYLDAQSTSGLQSENAVQTIPKAAIKEHYVLSTQQSKVYFLEELTQGEIGFHIPDYSLITMDLDAEKMRTALQSVVENNEALRTSFIKVDEEVYQKIDKINNLPIEFLEMSIDDAAEYAKNFFGSFDLSIAPLFRIAFIMVDSNKYLYLFDAHHIIMDAYSYNVFKSELFGAYQGKNIQTEKVQMKDFAEYQAAKSSSEVYLTQKAFWMENLAGELPADSYPVDYKHNSETGYEAKTYSFELDSKLTNKIKSIAKDNSMTAFPVIMSALIYTLFKCSRNEDVIVGIASMGRNNASLSNTIGMFVNNLPIRSAPKSNESVSELIKQVNQHINNAMANQEFPLEDIVNALKIPRDLSRSPIFDIVFSYMNFEHSEADGESIIAEKFDSDISLTSEYDIMFYGMEYATTTGFTLKYRKNLYREESIANLCDNFTNVLNQFVANQERSLNEIEVLSDYDKSKIAEFNSATIDYPKDKVFIEYFEEIVRKQPDSNFILHDEAKLSYSDANKIANRIANYIKEKYDIMPNDVIGLLLDKNEMMIPTIYGVLKSGAAYLPLEGNLPKERINFCLRDVGAKVVIAANEFADLVDGTECEELDSILSLSSNVDNPAISGSGDDLFNVIYTSGSTGIPKGVCVSQRNMMHFLHAVSHEYANHAADIYYSFISYSFDASVFNVVLPAFLGKQVRIFKTVFDIDDYCNLEKNIAIFSVPSVFNAYIDNNQVPENIKMILLGGENLTEAFVSKLIKPGRKLLNGYGPTETSVISSYYDYRDIAVANCIGKPLPNEQIYIVDSNNKLLPIGVYGEIVIAGDGVTKGYLNRDDLNAKSFVDNPFGSGRLYRTGDLGRWNHNGLLEYAGRIDRQTKIRGLRIELGEIESAVFKAEDNIQTATVVKKELQSGDRLICFIVAKSEVDLELLKVKLREHLPEYMIPDQFIFIKELPLNNNGKTDYKKLNDLEISLEISAPILPISRTQSKLFDIWSAVLGTNDFGTNSNFFEIGGDSLKALKIINRVNKEFASNVRVNEIFRYNTIQEFSSLLADKKSGLPALELLSVSEYYPCSAPQVRMWLLDKMLSERQVYNVPFVLKCKHAIDTEKFEAAVNSILAANEILRTVFIEVDAIPMQKILNDVKIHLVTKEIEPEQLDGLIKYEIDRLFVLSEFPLFKIVNFVIDGQSYLLFNFHHIIVDEWAMKLFMKQLIDAYSGDNSSFVESEWQYKEFAHYQAQLRQTELYQSQKEYWRAKFADYTPSKGIITDFPRKQKQSYQGNTLSFTLGEELSGGLQNIFKLGNATTLTGVLTLLNIVLHKYSGETDVTVGIPATLRTREEFKNTMGFFLNTLAVKNRIDVAQTFSSLLNQMKNNFFEDLDRQDYPFEELVDSLVLERDMSRSPLFDILLVSQDVSGDTQTMGSLNREEYSSYEFAYKMSKYDMTVFFDESANKLNFNIEYNSSLFTEQRIISFFEHIKLIAETIIDTPETSLDRLELLTSNDTKAINQLCRYEEETEFESISSLINRAAKANPEAIAVRYGSRKLTYAELNDRSDALASALRDCGEFEMSAPVGVYMDKSENTSVAILAILKAGAVYMPIDKSLPEKRIEFILKDSDCKIVLCAGDQIECTQAIKQIDIDSLDYSLMKIADLSSVEIHEKMPAYIIYTSGSTGTPKGILQTHSCLANLIKWQISEIPERMNILQYASLSFDVSVQEFLFAMASGSTLHVISNEARYDMGFIRKYISELSINLITMPNTILQVFIKSFEEADLALSLNHIISSGEQVELSKELKAFMHKNDVKLHNQYGPSETHVVTSLSLAPSQTDDYDRLPIGLPVAGTNIYIIDNEMHPVPVGVEGEIIVSGRNLALGYINLPELTAERFIQNPFGEGVVYRTGDTGYIDHRGMIVYSGRADSQVKLRGFRIELSEIEALADGLAGVDKTAAVVTNDVLTLFYALSTKGVEHSVIKSYLSEMLPAYMVPSHYVELDKIPVNNSGKIDKAALQKIKIDSSNEIEMIAPSNDIEAKLVEIWKAILSAEQVSTDSDFFEIGGSSIKAIQLMSQIRKVFDVALPSNLIFRFKTIMGLAEIIGSSDEKMGSLSDDYVVLNESDAGQVFFMPPGIGFSFAYFELAKLIKTSSIIGLNFLDNDNPVKDSTELIRSLMTNDEVILFGYSAGGNFTYDIARALKESGVSVKGIVLMDTYRQSEIIDWSEERYMEDAVLYIEKNHADFLSTDMRESALRKISAYRRHLNSRFETERLDVPIIHIIAEDEAKMDDSLLSRERWAELTDNYTELQGAGGHMDMLKQPFMSTNAKLIEQALEEIGGGE